MRIDLILVRRELPCQLTFELSQRETGAENNINVISGARGGGGDGGETNHQQRAPAHNTC